MRIKHKLEALGEIVAQNSRCVVIHTREWTNYLPFAVKNSENGVLGEVLKLNNYPRLSALVSLMFATRIESIC